MGTLGWSCKVLLELGSGYGPSRLEFLIHAEADYEINWKSFTKSSSYRSEFVSSVCVCVGGQNEAAHLEMGVKSGGVPEAVDLGLNE